MQLLLMPVNETRLKGVAPGLALAEQVLGAATSPGWGWRVALGDICQHLCAHPGSRAWGLPRLSCPLLESLHPRVLAQNGLGDAASSCEGLGWRRGIE